MDTSTIISVISLVIAGTTFFLTQLRAAKITSYVGPTVTLGYVLPRGFGIALPVTFTNYGVRTGAVLRSGVTLWRKDSPHDRYFMQWNSFVKQDFQTNKWINDEAAHTLAISGKSILAKVINFTWLATSQPQIVFREGTYSVAFHYWTNERHPHGKIHDIVLTDDMVRALNEVSETSSRTVLVTLDETITLNKHLNEYDFKKLIEGG
jgi:hypothetical protein